jgi:hypothetical protein
MAGELDAEPGQVALAWLRHRAVRSSTALILILGANHLPQLKGNLGALQVELSDEQARRLERVSTVALGFPHEALRRLRAAHRCRPARAAGCTRRARRVRALSGRRETPWRFRLDAVTLAEVDQVLNPSLLCRRNNACAITPARAEPHSQIVVVICDAAAMPLNVSNGHMCVQDC